MSTEPSMIRTAGTATNPSAAATSSTVRTARRSAFSAMFKWVQHTPVGQLKALTDERLQEVRDTLIKEVREVGRALHWVEGVIKLKAIERDKA